MMVARYEGLGWVLAWSVLVPVCAPRFGWLRRPPGHLCEGAAGEMEVGEFVCAAGAVVSVGRDEG